MFDYLNIRVYDDEKTDLLKYWDNTFKYITKAKKDGSKVLVHCKMGVSRSASVVIAYAMKAYNWNFEKALKHVKEKRSCIKPNTSFIAQLETYQGILDAMKNKEKLQRSKSETNLKSPEVLNKNEKKTQTDSPLPEKTEEKNMFGRTLKQIGVRPKSWSPDNNQSKNLLMEQNPIPAFFSLENLSKTPVAQNQKTAMNHVENARNILMPFNNGQSYSVSPNQIVHIPGNCKKENKPLDTAKEKVKGLVLNLTTQFEGEKSKPPSPEAQVKTPPQKDTGGWEAEDSQCYCNKSEDVVWTSSRVLKQTNNDSVLNVDVSKQDNSNISKVIVRKEGDPFSNRLDRVFDREERKQHRNSVVQPEGDETRKCPSRQSSWSSYDSAVVLGFQGETRDAPSRHSSWGSGDTRTLPSRNSSWGSYDMRRGQIGHVITEKEDKSNEILSASSSGMFPYDKDEIPWYPGTVKRTKQKLEGNSEKRVCSVPKNLNSEVSQNKSPSIETLSEFPLSHAAEYKSGILHYQSSPTLCSSKKSVENLKGKSKEIDILNDVALSNESRLSVSAPGSSSLSVISNDFVPLSPKCKKTDFTQYKKISDNLKTETVNSDCVQGIVKNLKKEFEAKTQNGESEKERSVSLPLTPKNTTEDTEDLSVKELVGKYEINKEDNKDSDIQSSPILRNKCIFNNKNVRYSCFEVLSDGQEKESYNTIIPSGLYSEPDRPKKPLNSGGPITFVTSTVVKAAAKKQQQLRNRDYHTNYTMKTRNHPTHNTM